MNKLTWIILIVLSASLATITACDDNDDDWDYEDAYFQKDTIAIFNYFDEEQFESDSLLPLLEEIGICKSEWNTTDTSARAICSPRNYKFFKYNKSMSWSAGFGLEIRATVDDFPLRRFILFERIDGKLAKTRGFVANLAEMHTTKSGYNDLMLLFPDKEAGSFVVKYVWDEEESSYEYQSLEAIDGYPVKKERQDSLSNVVLQRLTENNMFF
jgi:hypothetical protein